MFGLKPSPAILGATIKYHLSEHSTSQAETINVLENDLYVDDLATGTDSEDKIMNLYKPTKEAMAKAGFHLRKWKTNPFRV